MPLVFFLIVLSSASTVKNSLASLPKFEKIDGVKHAFIYGYNGTLIIAKVQHAGYNQIYHTSFEEATADVTVVANARTGRKVFSGTSFTIPADQSPIAGTYILSCWELEGTVWSYRQQEVAYAPSSPLFTTTKFIDEVRLYPKGARMTTYAYDPLIGITSETGPNGISIFYEYDTQNRLKFVKDQDGNIVKNYYYNYKIN
jgi:YD repeat-containing protein